MTDTSPILVVVPTRDRPAHLAEALRTVLAQTDGGFVVVVADDGDGPPVEADPSLPRDPRLSFVRTTARAAGGARNAAIAFGEERVLRGPASLVALLDDDDRWDPPHLALARAALAAAPEAPFVHGGARTVAERSETDYHEREDGLLAGDVFRGLLRRNFVATSSVVMRASAWRAVGGFRADVRHGEDLALWLELARRGPVAYVEEVTTTYLAHGENTSGDLVAKARDQLAVVEAWWPRRHRLAPADRCALARARARRRARLRRRSDRGLTPIGSAFPIGVRPRSEGG